MDTLVLLYTIESDAGSAWIGLVPILRGNDGRLVFSRTFRRICEFSDLMMTAATMTTRVAEAIQAMGREVELRAAAAFLVKLRSEGSILGQQLIPAELTQLFLERNRIRHVIFCFDPQLNAVPFEWICLDGEFLCYRFATGRELLSANPCGRRQVDSKRALPYTGRFIISPPGDLNAVEREQISKEIIDFFSECSRNPKANQAFTWDSMDFNEEPTAEDVLDAFQTREIVNVYCHHAYDETCPGNSAFVLGRETTLSAQQLVDGFSQGDVAPRLVFSLCCESARARGWSESRPNPTRIFGMVDAAVRIGVPHYIGAVVKIPALKSVALLKGFYQCLSAGYTVGEALRRARSSLRQIREDPEDGGTVLGLALVLYGDPSVALLSGSLHRTAEIHTPLCEASVNAGVCGKAVAPGDAGYASQLCPEHSSTHCSAGHALTDGNSLLLCRHCSNTLCPKCPGWGKRLCWEHCCFQGDEIIPGARKKICGDPQRRHHQEKRSVCALDPGWLDGLCRECIRDGRNE